jgi:hypothetical protein
VIPWLIYGVRYKGHFVEDINIHEEAEKKNQSMYWGNKILKKREWGRKEHHISLGFLLLDVAINNGTPGLLRIDLIFEGKTSGLQDPRDENGSIGVQVCMGVSGDPDKGTQVFCFYSIRLPIFRDVK